MKHQDTLLTCGCCEGTEILTPLPTANRPGLGRLAYRVGTHATFLQTMKARLSTLCLGNDQDCQADEGLRPLQQLTTRAGSDPAIAFLDAWATVADVLTFYQERLLNEGYLPTAVERRSILELARLVGYKLGPGVAASVYLAFELEDEYDIEIAAGTRAQSIPDGANPDELPQSFETSEPLHARAPWNAIQPRQTRPQRITLNPNNPDLESDARLIDSLYFQGTATNLDTNDPLLLVFGQDPQQQVFRRVQKVEIQEAEDRTKVFLQPISSEQIVADLINELQAALAHHISVGPGGSTAESLKDLLTELQSGFAENVDTAVISLDQQYLPSLHQTLVDMPDTFTNLKPWLADVVADLEEWESNIQPLLAPASMSESNAMETVINLPEQATENHYPPGSILPFLAQYNWVNALKQPPSVQPANGLALARSPAQTFNLKGDTVLQLLTATNPAVSQNLYQVVASAQLSPPSPVQVYALRTTASLFGHNAPKEIRYETEDNGHGDSNNLAAPGQPLPQDEWPEWTPAPDERGDRLFLDNAFDDILPDGYIAIQRAEDAELNAFAILTSPISTLVTGSRNAYGISGKTTIITLPDDQPWWEPDGAKETFIQFIRGTTVYAQSELLELAEAPISTPDKPVVVAGSHVELGGLYDGLETGRWIILSGERSDIANAASVTASELVMIAAVEQSYDPTLPGDRPHTTLVLANEGLAYSYKRDTVTIYANVAKATHGETHQEVLGSGDGKQAFPQFDLKQSPLTHVAAATAAGAASTLEVRINDVRWHEAEALFPLDAASRNYITQTDNEQKTTVIFGDGQRGARLPTGIENVTAAYRNGIGKPGNVAAEQISMLVTRPLGVQGVNNPLRASGGADPESRDQARRNVPLVTMALDRLVSLPDYEDFARTFAGIGKANAMMLTDGRRQLVHLSIAGVDDIPIDENSDLYRNLRLALRQNGDPFQPFQVQVRELVALIISANVRLHPDYQWEPVVSQIRTALLAAFSFEQREMGQDVLLSEVISVIQGVTGVTYVDVDILEGISETEVTNPVLLADKLSVLAGQINGQQPKQRLPVYLARVDNAGTIQPAQLAFITPETPDTLILTEIS